MTIDELVEEAERRYPVGTEFYPAHIDSRINSNVITEGSRIEKPNYGNNVDLNKVHLISKGGNKIGYWASCVYFNGKWAEIIKHVVTTEQSIQFDI